MSAQGPSVEQVLAQMGKGEIEARAMRLRARKILDEPTPVRVADMAVHVARQAAAREILGES